MPGRRRFNLAGNRVPSWPFSLNRDSPQAQGLVGWWPTPEIGLVTVRDLSERGGNGIGTGLGVIPTQFGAQAFDYQDAQDRVSISDRLPAKGGGSGNDLMLMAWVVPANITDRMFVLNFQQNDGASTDPDWAVLELSGAEGGDPVTAEWRSVTTDNAQSRFTSGFVANVPQHVGALFTGVNSSLEAHVSLDGNIEGPNTTSSPSDATDDNSLTHLYHGVRRRSGTFSTQFVGQMWDARLYDIYSPAIMQLAHDPATRWDLYWQPSTRSFHFPAAAAPASNVEIANVSEALSTAAGGTTDFTKADFGTPAICRIIVSFDAVDDTGAAVESKVSIGFSDFTDDFCITHQDEDGSAKVDSDARKSNTKSYVVLDAAGAVLFSGTASAITDGVRLTHTAGEAPASAFFASVTMWGGTALVGDLRRTVIASALDGTATITHAGLTDGNDKLIFFIGTDIAGEDSSSTGINNSYGVCHISGNDAGGYTFTQRCLSWCSDHNNAVGSPFAGISTDRVLDMITEAGVQDWSLEVTAFSSSGGTITVTTRDVAAGAGMEVYSFIIDLDDRKAKVGSVDGPTSGATWTPAVALGFVPQWVDLMLTDLTNEDTITIDAEAGVMGISSNSGAGGETCHSWYNEDAAATINTNNLFRSRAIDLRDHDVSTVLQDHSHLSFNNGDWTYTINAENETVAKKWAFATIAAAGVPNILIGQAIETDTAFGIQALRTALLGLSSETDAAQPVNPTKGATLGLASESDSAFTITIDRALVLGQSVETDTATEIARLKSVLIGLATETDEAFAITIGTGILVGQASESDAAFPMGSLKEVLIGLSTETDSALTITPLRATTITIGQASEADTAQTVTALRALLIGLGLETDQAFPITIPGAPVVAKGMLLLIRRRRGRR